METKRIAEENERKRSVLYLWPSSTYKLTIFQFVFLFSYTHKDYASWYHHSYIAQRKAEKEEERRARERIRQKLEQDKVEPDNFQLHIVYYHACTRTRALLKYLSLLPLFPCKQNQSFLNNLYLTDTKTFSSNNILLDIKFHVLVCKFQVLSKTFLPFCL